MLVNRLTPLLTAALFACSLASPPGPHPWVSHPTTPVDPASPHSFTLFLSRGEPGAMGRLSAAASAVSDPSHASYGRHLSDDEIRSLVRPVTGSVPRIAGWIGAVCGGVVEVRAVDPRGRDVPTEAEVVGSTPGAAAKSPSLHVAVGAEAGSDGRHAKFRFARARGGRVPSRTHSLSVHRHGDSVTVSTTVRCAESLFGIRLAAYRHVRTSRVITRTSSPERVMPSAVADVVDVVLGVWDFPAMKRVGSGGVHGDAAATAATAAPASGGTPAGPLLRVMRGLDQGFKFTLTPYCADGSPASRATGSSSLCLGQSLEPSAVVVSIAGAGLPPRDITIPLDAAADCTDASPTVCTVVASPDTGEPVANYVPFYAKVSVTYGGSGGPATSEATASAHPFVASPPVIVESLRQAYGIPDGTVVTDPRSTSCVVEFEEQYYSPEDLRLFLADNGLSTDPNVTVIGSNNATDPGGEANLDIQWMLGLAPGSPMTFWSIKQNSTLQVDNILAWETALMNLPASERPLVTSISYGMAAMYVDQFFGPGYLARSDEEFAKIATTAATVLIADGDTGVFDDVPPFSLGCNGGKLRPDWPSQSAFVTAVSATFLTPFSSPICYDPSSGVNCVNTPVAEASVSVTHGLFWTTGGGFSTTQPRPSYQSAVVERFLNISKALPAGDNFNRGGRGYADVAAVGHNLECRIAGKAQSIDGTSAASPIFAAMLVLVNDRRLAAGKAPLGFANPVMYANEDKFRDVTVGNNGCGAYDGSGSAACCYEQDPSYVGFEATPGWDPVSGLGTFANYETLTAALVAN